MTALPSIPLDSRASSLLSRLNAHRARNCAVVAEMGKRMPGVRVLVLTDAPQLVGVTK